MKWEENIGWILRRFQMHLDFSLKNTHRVVDKRIRVRSVAADPDHKVLA